MVRCGSGSCMPREWHGGIIVNVLEKSMFSSSNRVVVNWPIRKLKL